jgi:hypothetical protein
VKPPTSVAQFKQEAERIFREANPDATDATITWTHAAAVTWADRSTGFSGVAQVAATGYRARSMVASFHDGGLWVR